MKTEKSSWVGKVSGQLFSASTPPLPDAVASLLASSVRFVGAALRS